MTCSLGVEGDTPYLIRHWPVFVVWTRARVEVGGRCGEILVWLRCWRSAIKHGRFFVFDIRISNMIGNRSFTRYDLCIVPPRRKISIVPPSRRTTSSKTHSPFLHFFLRKTVCASPEKIMSPRRPSRHTILLVALASLGLASWISVDHPTIKLPVYDVETGIVPESITSIRDGTIYSFRDVIIFPVRSSWGAWRVTPARNAMQEAPNATTCPAAFVLDSDPSPFSQGGDELELHE